MILVTWGFINPHAFIYYMGSRRPGYAGLALGGALLLGGCSKPDTVYVQGPERTVYVERPVERVVYVERPKEAISRVGCIL